MLERGEPGHVLVQDVVFARVGRQRPQFGDGGVQVAGRPRHGGVEDQAECAELVFLALAICLHDLPALAVADVPGPALWRDSWIVSCRFI